MFAVREGHIDVVNALIDAGADLNAPNPDGLTALLMAVINDQLDLAVHLIDKGANPNDGSLYEAIQVHNRRTTETNGDASRPRLCLHQNTLTPLDLIAPSARKRRRSQPSSQAPVIFRRSRWRRHRAGIVPPPQ